MTEMVDRVAMVIDQGIMMDDDPDDIARAAIEAMREPNEAMLKVADRFETSEHAYSAMIDEALK